MTTASVLMGALQTELGDSAGAVYTSAVLYGWLDEAQKEFVGRLMSLRGIDGTSVAKNQSSFPVPSDLLSMEVVVSRQGMTRKVKRVTPTDMVNQQTAAGGATATDPSVWTEMDGRVYVWPPYSGASKTTTVNASTSATATTITMASTSNLRSTGRVEIDSEEIEYTGKTSTTVTGARRGIGGTTAATHVSAATVTQVDLEFIYRRQAVALASTAAPEIRAPHHEKLKLYAKYLAYMQEGSFDKAQSAYQLWQQALKDAEYTEKREYLGEMRVRDIETQLVSDLYGPL